MKFFEVNIGAAVSSYLKQALFSVETFTDANALLAEKSGIQSFFSEEDEFKEFKTALDGNGISSNRNHTEYGDYQTNISLAKKVVGKLKAQGIKPEVILEPTFGEGNFLLAALEGFDSVTEIYGVELYKPYVWQAKFSLLEIFVLEPDRKKPKIYLSHDNVFDYDFEKLSNDTKNQSLLVLGNPPWVTNSQLGALDSSNLPVKSNFKKLAGFDAMTGKGNFDIAEYITLMMFDNFKHHKGHLAFLVKNAVVKNVIHDQKARQYPIGNFQSYSIDTKKEFNASVESCLFYCTLNAEPGFQCKDFDFYNEQESRNKYGWHKGKFVADLEHYIETENFDGLCPYEWRQGLKHDCSAVMELEYTGTDLLNGNGERADVEADLLYGLLKSSDLKNGIVNNPRKYTIVTQKKIGQDTSFIQSNHRKTFAYLERNRAAFDKRKSSIYNGKPAYSIFGVGDYSFKPYKVAISGLYKESRFTLVLPQDGKPLMLDDTCYFLGFVKLEFAAYTYALLNHPKTQTFLKSITFLDAKRAFTKNSLMRLDLAKIARSVSVSDVEAEMIRMGEQIGSVPSMNLWNEYVFSLQDAPMLAFA